MSIYLFLKNIYSINNIFTIIKSRGWLFIKKLFICLLSIFSLLFIWVIFTNYQSSFDYSLEILDISTAKSNVIDWVTKNTYSNGIYLVKDSNTNIYYLYVNNTQSTNNIYTKYYNISLNSNKKNNLVISTSSKESTEKQEVLLKITVKGKILNKIILNEQELNVNLIPRI